MKNFISICWRKVCRYIKRYIEFQKYSHLFREEYEKYENYAKKQEFIVDICVGISVASPLLIGLLSIFKENPCLLQILKFTQNGNINILEQHFLSLILFALSLIAVIAGLIYFIIKPKDSNFIADALKYQETRTESIYFQGLFDRTETEIYRNTYTLGAIDSILLKLNKLLSHQEQDRKAQYFDFANLLLASIYEALDNYKLPDERFSASIYLHNPNEQTLVDVFESKRHPKFIKDKIEAGFSKEEAKRGRTWPLNSNSHVCHVFNGGVNRIFGNLNEDIKPKSQQSLPADSENYVSSVTIPISYDNDVKRGVLCITSNKENAFDSCEDEDILKILKRTRQMHIFTIARLLQLSLNQTYASSNDEIINITTNSQNQGLVSP